MLLEIPITTDVRGGLPSASSLERLALCPGSFYMEQGMSDVSSAIALEGTLLHAVLAGEASYDTLTPDQQATVDLVRAAEAKVVSDCFGNNSHYVYNEERLWYRDGNGEVIFSGQFDKLYVSNDGSKAIIIDFKFGHIPVMNIAYNVQLRAYAVLVRQSRKINQIFVGAIQPRCSNQSELCYYTEHDLDRYEKELLGFIAEAQKPDAPRIPSEKACKYCKAKSKCPEAQKTVEALVPLRSVDMEKKVGQLSADQLSRMLDVAELAEDVIEALKNEAKARLAIDPNSVPGRRLAPGNSVREVFDPAGAFQAIKNVGIDAPEFLSTCKVGLGNLEKLYAKKTGLKGAEAKKSLEDAIAHTVRKNQQADKMVRV